MEFSDMIMENGLAVLPVLWVLGMLLKQTPFIRDWLIPYILLGVSILLCGMSIGWSLDGIVQGVLVAGVSVMGHQLIKQTIKRDGQGKISTDKPDSTRQAKE